MKFVRVTSYIKDDSYTAEDNGLLMKDRLKEIPAIINFDDVVFAFPSNNGTAGAMIRLRNGVSLDIKETIDEIWQHLDDIIDPDTLNKLFNPPDDAYYKDVE